MQNGSNACGQASPERNEQERKMTDDKKDKKDQLQYPSAARRPGPEPAELTDKQLAKVSGGTSKPRGRPRKNPA